MASLLAALSVVCLAQSFVLDLPRQSQHAVVSQRIGITDITINYHRPLVNDRKVWGRLVPYGQVWRAGANENTTITFSDPVTIEGKPLDRGTYGLHMIPNADEWTVIFSKNSTSWGAFTYKQDEDALRVNVKPQTAEMHNALTYDFDERKAGFDGGGTGVGESRGAVQGRGGRASAGGSQPEEATAEPVAVHVDELG